MSFPKIKNRRKYPRLEISNICNITIKESGMLYLGKLNNISANGFAFMSSEGSFADYIGKNVSIEIKDFEIKNHNVLEARVIRATNSDGMYIVGCQMPEDDRIIMDFVSKRIANAFDV